MQTIAIAVAVTAILSGAIGAGATTLALSYSVKTQVSECVAAPTAAQEKFSSYRPVPTTGSRSF